MLLWARGFPESKYPAQLFRSAVRRIRIELLQFCCLCPIHLCFRAMEAIESISTRIPGSKELAGPALPLSGTRYQQIPHKRISSLPCKMMRRAHNSGWPDLGTCMLKNKHLAKLLRVPCKSGEMYAGRASCEKKASRLSFMCVTSNPSRVTRLCITTDLETCCRRQHEGRNARSDLKGMWVWDVDIILAL